MSSDSEADDGPLASVGRRMPFGEFWEEGVGCEFIGRGILPLSKTRVTLYMYGHWKHVKRHGQENKRHMGIRMSLDDRGVYGVLFWVPVNRKRPFVKYNIRDDSLYSPCRAFRLG